jgi:hypothetical protein
MCDQSGVAHLRERERERRAFFWAERERDLDLPTFLCERECDLRAFLCERECERECERAIRNCLLCERIKKLAGVKIPFTKNKNGRSAYLGPGRMERAL